jgi:hypothetical protein
MLVDVGLDAATVTLVSLLWASKEGDGWSAEEEVARIREFGEVVRA